MSKTSVRPTPRIPLPKGTGHEAWIVDLTPLAWLRVTWGSKCPYRYTPAGQIVRMVMPRDGVARHARLMVRLSNYVHRDRAAIIERFKLPDEWTDDMVSTLLLSKALIEKHTRFVVINIEPDGRTVMFHRLRPLRSRHPGSPGRGIR